MTNLNTETTIPSANQSVVATALLNAINEKAAAAKTAKTEVKAETVSTLTNGTRDYASMRRFMKKYGRAQVQTALQTTAKEVAGKRRVPYPLTAKIVVLSDNPHRAGTKDNALFASFKKNGTVEKALAAGVNQYAIGWYADRNMIRVDA